MAVVAKTFCDLATILRDKNLPRNSEACHRCAINRAYYGAYHAAAIYVGIPPTREKTKHFDVISKLGDQKPYLEEILTSLYWKRWDADYDLFTRITKSDVEKAITTANTIINELNQG